MPCLSQSIIPAAELFTGINMSSFPIQVQETKHSTGVTCGGLQFGNIHASKYQRSAALIAA